MGKLVLFDLMILWRSAGAAFARKRDIFLLLAVVPIGLFLAFQRAGEVVVAAGELYIAVKMMIAAATALIVNWAVGRRLTHLREESVMARQALRTGAAVVHAGFWNLPALAGIIALILASPESIVVAALFLSYATGIALAAGWRIVRGSIVRWSAQRRNHTPKRQSRVRGATRGRRMINLISGRSGLFGASATANMLGLAAIGAVIALLHASLPMQLAALAPALVATLLVLILFLILLRAKPSLLRYLLYLGFEPTIPALVASALAAALIGGALIVTLATAAAAPLAILASAALLLILFFVLALLRTLHFASKPRQAAELAIQIDLIAAALTGLVLLPLAPALLVVRLWLLARRARAMRFLAQ